MATRAAKATMDAEARKRMVAALDTLRERFDLEMPPERSLVRDPEYAAITEREDMATILEQLVKATDPKKDEPEPQPFAAAPGDYRPVQERSWAFSVPAEAPEKPEEPTPAPEQPKRPVGRPRRSGA